MKVTWQSKLPDIVSQQLPFAIAQTANALAQMAADDIRDEARRKLKVRSTTLLRFFVRGPSERATKQKPTARVFIGAPKGAKDPERGNLLIQHDVDGTNVKRPFRSDSLMVPTKQYRQESGGRPRSWKALKRDMGIGTKRGIATRGNLLGAGRRFRTYLIEAKTGKLAGRTLLFARDGTGKRNTSLLYMSAPQIKNPVRLRSRAIAAIRVRKSASTLMGRELTRAVASAKAVTKGGGVASTRLAS